LSREGETLGTLGEPGDFEQMALSPDGRHLVAEVVDSQGGIDLWSFDTARGVASRVTTDPASERDPVWLPDGLELAYSLSMAGGRLVRQGLRAGAPVSPVVEGDASYIPESVTPNGRTLLASSPHSGDAAEFVIWAIPLDGEGAPEAVLRSEFTLDEFQVSPDGRWLAYISTESGRFEVYVEPFRRPGERVRVSTEGGGQPRWREDGKELIYSAGNAVMAVSVEDTETRLEVGTPRKLFDAPSMRPGWDDYAVTPDGQRFLVKVPIGEEPEPRFHVVLNWPSLLE
jgi:Tol biopolymer transport system component